MNEQDEAPMVTFNRITKTAHFTFRQRRRDLPGTYQSLADAQVVAERMCRAEGWKG